MSILAGDLDGIDHHQFYLVLTDSLDFIPQYPAERAPIETADGDFAAANTHRLVAASGPSVVVETGVAMGVVGVTLEFLDAAPDGIDESRQWEAVSEVSVEASDHLARLAVLMDEVEDPFALFVLPGGPGWYRVRGHAVGRALDFDGVVSGAPREFHLLQLWRAEAYARPREHRRDDQWAGQGTDRETEAERAVGSRRGDGWISHQRAVFGDDAADLVDLLMSTTDVRLSAFAVWAAEQVVHRSRLAEALPDAPRPVDARGRGLSFDERERLAAVQRTAYRLGNSGSHEPASRLAAQRLHATNALLELADENDPLDLAVTVFVLGRYTFWDDQLGWTQRARAQLGDLPAPGT